MVDRCIQVNSFLLFCSWAFFSVASSLVLSGSILPSLDHEGYQGGSVVYLNHNQRNGGRGGKEQRRGELRWRFGWGIWVGYAQSCFHIGTCWSSPRSSAFVWLCEWEEPSFGSRVLFSFMLCRRVLFFRGGLRPWLLFTLGWDCGLPDWSAHSCWRTCRVWAPGSGCWEEKETPGLGPKRFGLWNSWARQSTCFPSCQAPHLPLGLRGSVGREGGSTFVEVWRCIIGYSFAGISGNSYKGSSRETCQVMVGCKPLGPSLLRISPVCPVAPPLALRPKWPLWPLPRSPVRLGPPSYWKDMCRGQKLC